MDLPGCRLVNYLFLLEFCDFIFGQSKDIAENIIVILAENGSGACRFTAESAGLPRQVIESQVAGNRMGDIQENTAFLELRVEENALDGEHGGGSDTGF